MRKNITIRIAPEYNAVLNEHLSRINEGRPRKKQLSKVEYTRLLASENKLMTVSIDDSSLLGLMRSVQQKIKREGGLFS